MSSPLLGLTAALVLASTWSNHPTPCHPSPQGCPGAQRPPNPSACPAHGALLQRGWPSEPRQPRKAATATLPHLLCPRPHTALLSLLPGPQLFCPGYRAPVGPSPCWELQAPQSSAPTRSGPSWSDLSPPCSLLPKLPHVCPSSGLCRCRSLRRMPFLQL